MVNLIRWILRLWRKLYPVERITRRTTDPERVISALLLTEFDKVDAAVVHAWTDDQRADAFEWAMREHLRASDNYDVERWPKPEHVKALPVHTWGSREDASHA